MESNENNVPEYNTVYNFNTVDRYQHLLLDRTLFEIQVYDYLVNPILFISEDFWDPVKVGLTHDDISKCSEVLLNDNCIICTNDCNAFREVRCCKNKLCMECTDKWFSESVRCPFCIQDLRDFI